MNLADAELHVTVRGTSMSKAGLKDGDVVLAKPGVRAKHNDIVVAELPDDEGTVIKRYREARAAGRVHGAWLLAETDEPGWAPLRVTPQVRILGVVTGKIVPAGDPLAEMPAAAPPNRPLHFWKAPSAASGVAPLFDYLVSLIGGMDLGEHQLARGLGVSPEDFEMIRFGHVPDEVTLTRMASRLATWTGRDIKARDLLRFQPHIERP